MAKAFKKDRKAKQTNLANPRPVQTGSLVEFFRQSPLMGLELDLTRDPDVGRDIDLGDELGEE
jgi:hypothetical protein